MYELKLNEIHTVSGAALNLNDIVGMINSGMSMAAIGKIGLSTATEERSMDWGHNVAGDAGYIVKQADNPMGYKITRWFFDGAGYVVS